MGYRIGVDIGGTFTDFCIFNDATNDLLSLKVLSRPDAPGSEVMEGIRQIDARYGIKPKDVVYFTHGSTVGINTVIQRKGLRLALFTTAAFEDVLEVARLKMPDPYNLFSRRPEPLVTRDRVIGIKGRIAADGSVDAPVEEADVLAALAKARALGAEGIIVSLLHCYRNPAHEQQVKGILAKAAPDMPVFLSSEIWPIIREYERTTTAVVGSYPQTRVAHYLTALQKALKDIGVAPEPQVTKSNGGIMKAELGKTASLQVLLSGTASGVMGAAYVSRLCDLKNCMSLDVGGTSADVAFVIDGQPQYGVGEIVGEFPIYIPTVAVTSIGAGGGSIAHVDAQGVLKVGPESAGSRPGPACYGRGGDRPTITDAFVACGFMGSSAGAQLGYRAVTIDPAKARAAIDTVAKPLKLGTVAAAEAIIKVAVSGMFMEVSKLVSRYGVDIRDFALLPFGGAGPMLGCFLARDLGVKEVVVPPTPGVLSAMGGLIADFKNDFIKTAFVDAAPAAMAAVRESFAGLRAQALRWLKEEQGYQGKHRLAYAADMRYRGQSFEIETPLEERWIEAGDAKAVAAAFHERHKQLYQYADAEAAVQMINLRLVVIGESPKPSFKKLPDTREPAKPAATIEVTLDGAKQSVPFYRRVDLKPGQRFSGPAVVAQDDCTTCVPGGFAIAVDAYGNLRLTLTK
ncbi:MAG: hydantoinase/oxoprolinase family protein [Alphaproteobacteria bacterium]|nr:hydantoinase/oxoprolinase family protein [Alphaproteobacteria bacterium]